MKLESQVCSLEISKRLKELGVKQDGHFMWRDFIPQDLAVLVVAEVQRSENEYFRGRNRPEIQERFDKENRFYSAFTVAELGEMLPEEIITTKMDKTYKLSYYHRFRNDLIKEEADTEANARGKMLIYLLENKLIKL